MRKFLLSAFVVLSFFFYALHKGVEGKMVNAATTMEQGLGLATVAPTLAPEQKPSPFSGPGPSPTPTPQSKTNSNSSPAPTPKSASSPYRDGQYTGNSADAYYGNIQVAVTIVGGKITDVTFLDYPKDRSTSVEINSQAMPYLKQEAIAAQSAKVDIVSGATDSSRAFIQSLGSALSKAS